jgi:hypothetical protein
MDFSVHHARTRTILGNRPGSVHPHPGTCILFQSLLPLHLIKERETTSNRNICLACIELAQELDCELKGRISAAVMLAIFLEVLECIVGDV